MKPPGPCHRGHPQASPQPTSRDPAGSPLPSTASCRHHAHDLLPSQPTGSPGEVLSFQLLFFCNTRVPLAIKSAESREGEQRRAVPCHVPMAPPCQLQGPLFLWHSPFHLPGPSVPMAPSFIFQAPLFLWHPPASIQRPVFLWHSTLIFQDPLFLWHPPASFQDPLFLWHSPFNLPGPSAPVASSSHSRTLCSYGTSLPAPRAPASPTLHSSGERRAQTFSQPQPHRHSHGKKPQRLRGQAPAPADGRESRHCSRQQRRRPRRAGDGDQPLSLNSGVGGIPPLLDGQGMSRAQESR